ncbi:MAG: hypothetical protein ABSE73_09640 [Planctomycetota bacterium]
MEQEKELSSAEICGEEKAAKFVLGGSLLEGLGGLATTVLAFLALWLFVPSFFGAVATIIVGLALLFDAGLLSARLPFLLLEVGKGEVEAERFRGGLAAELVGGIIAVILGIMSLCGVDPTTLTAFAAVVLGTALLLESGVVSRLSSFVVRRPGESGSRAEMARRCVRMAASLQVFVGLGTIVLGILALLGLHPGFLSLVALLAVGLSTAFSGASLGWRMLKLVHH